MKTSLKARAISLTLAASMAISTLPASAFGAIMPRSYTSHYAHACGTGASVAEVDTYDELRTALGSNAVTDVVITGSFSITDGLTVSGTKHIYAADTQKIYAFAVEEHLFYTLCPVMCVFNRHVINTFLLN